MLAADRPDPEVAVPRRPPGRLAALDLGTNNCRLLVAEPRTQGFHVVDSFSRIVRLGEGLAATGELGERAIVRTLAALKVCGGSWTGIASRGSAASRPRRAAGR